MEVVEDVLQMIANEAQDADQKAAHACMKSKYSTQDYYLCLEFYLARLHDRIAKEYGIQKRCEIFPFRKKLNNFRRGLIKDGI
jgi:hypothetical protein